MMALSYRAALETPLLAVEEERTAIRGWQERGDRTALELLLRSHARQVYAQVQRWSRDPAETEDLVAEGMIGLMRAADQFDMSQDVRFSTYAHWWVMTSVATALARMRSLVDMPARTYLDARMGRLTGPDRDRVLQAMGGHVSLDALTFEDGAARMGDQLCSPEMTPEEQVAARSSEARMRDVLAGALAKLAPEDRAIVERRKLAAQPEPIERIASELGISRDRARMVERRALARLKLLLQRNGFSASVLNERI